VEIEFSWVMPKRDRPIQELLEKTVQTLLFNRIREELCLAYSVQTRCERYADAAIMRVAVIAAPETEKRCIREVRKTLGDDSKLAEEFLHLRSEMLLTARFADKNVKTMVADTVDEFATDGMLRSGKQILAAYQTATAEQIVGLRTNDMSFKNAHLLITEE
jgi:predicted Zn-dependent peptidase